MGQVVWGGPDRPDAVDHVRARVQHGHPGRGVHREPVLSAQGALGPQGPRARTGRHARAGHALRSAPPCGRGRGGAAGLRRGSGGLEGLADGPRGRASRTGLAVRAQQASFSSPRVIIATSTAPGPRRGAPPVADPSAALPLRQRGHGAAVRSAATARPSNVLRWKTLNSFYHAHDMPMKH